MVAASIRGPELHPGAKCPTYPYTPIHLRNFLGGIEQGETGVTGLDWFPDLLKALEAWGRFSAFFRLV